ncbi:MULTISPECIES: TatD family hydrolase [unclassified Pseudoalteromonas]|uniref:TatD family hydrolase n=1 Tax=unclassified Pseudoalteromonas TaxID=194690 RepID=UPI000B3C1F9E|nr:MULTISPECIES: TatD family hydrolase [unclassified Pseudoalteromonas]MDN3378751.1 TatD family hydrolase [Pseudoalteromonas sp. APC 3893]MDN3387239.1 TatD family hydrolase [Pseudoalteromonas sp. APC 4017]OUS73820.1 hydrolase TatD [Pseudoalteromonas sp. A601]
MTSMLIDAGVNLTNHQFDGQHEAVIARAKAEKINQMLLIGCDVQSSQQAQSLAEKHQLLATAGVHPHDAKTVDQQLEQQLTLLAQQKQVVAIGECGLDYNRDFSPRDIQRSVFTRQLILAEQLNFPVYLHERDASEDMLKILKQYRVRGVLHCFTGNKHALEQYLELGLYIGITGWVCDERRGQELQQLIPSIPLERLLLETDAPFLIPRTIKPKPKSRRNEPCYLPYVCQTIATLKGLDFATVAKQTTLNFQQLFITKA